ncbi:MAG: hypothetical protein ACOCYZ_00060 [Halococcoides sp.]
MVGHGFGRPASDGFSVATRTHPPTDERVARLRALTAELEDAGVDREPAPA